MWRKKFRYLLIEHCISEVYVSDCEHGRLHWFEHLNEGQEARESKGGPGVGTVVMESWYQPGDNVLVLGFRNVEEGGN